MRGLSPSSWWMDRCLAGWLAGWLAGLQLAIYLPHCRRSKMITHALQQVDMCVCVSVSFGNSVHLSTTWLRRIQELLLDIGVPASFELTIASRPARKPLALPRQFGMMSVFRILPLRNGYRARLEHKELQL
jgi:hypothetical protein